MTKQLVDIEKEHFASCLDVVEALLQEEEEDS